jgi:hypothetical protein
MLKSIFPKVLFVAAILMVITAGNYLFEEEPQDNTSVAASATNNQGEAKPADEEPADDEPADIEEETYE